METQVFKPGDRVRLIRTVSVLREGEVFTVTDYYQGLGDNMMVDLLDGQGRTVRWVYAHRFVKEPSQ